MTVDISQTVVGEQTGQGWHAVPGEDNQDDGDADDLGTEHHPLLIMMCMVMLMVTIVMTLLMLMMLMVKPHLHAALEVE